MTQLKKSLDAWVTAPTTRHPWRDRRSTVKWKSRSTRQLPKQPLRFDNLADPRVVSVDARLVSISTHLSVPDPAETSVAKRRGPAGARPQRGPSQPETEWPRRIRQRCRARSRSVTPSAWLLLTLGSAFALASRHAQPRSVGWSASLAAYVTWMVICLPALSNISTR